MSKPHPIQVVPSPAGFCLTRSGARYTIEPSGEEHRGTWLPENEALPTGWIDAFPEAVARALLPLLRDLEGRAAGRGGRKAAEPTTPDGKLVAGACECLGVTAAALADRIGTHASVLSRARHGQLPVKYRKAIRELLRPGRW